MAAPTLITFVAGQPALAEDVNDNFDAIAGKFNYGIADSDISDTAKIKGYKLSSTSGEQVPENRLANNAASARVLQADATAGHALAAVATGDHIKDGIITAEKLATGVRPVLVSKAFSLAAVTVSIGLNLCGVGQVILDVNYPVASWDLVACYVVNFNYVAGTLYSLSVWADSSQTNWRGWVSALGDNIGTGTGSVVFVFQAKP
jgi:hypothetical protein